MFLRTALNVVRAWKGSQVATWALVRRGSAWAGLLLGGALAGAEASGSMEVLPDLPYAGTTNPHQRLDLYLPKSRVTGAQLPVIVYVHGGGWGGGSKASGRAVLQSYVQSGAYAGVAVAYRLSGEVRWPAQIHDCMAAIRWIRAEAGRYGLDPGKIGAIGGSAGGTLVTLLAVGGGVAELEGSVGPHLGQSSRVTCAVNRFGRLNFLAEPAAARAAPAQAAAVASRLQILFGGAVEEKAPIARLASAVNHISADDAPILTTHGTNDSTVPIAQAEEFDAAMRRAGRPHLFVRVAGAGHGFENPEEKRRSRQFFDLHLRGIPTEVSTEPILHPGKKQDSGDR